MKRKGMFFAFVLAVCVGMSVPALAEEAPEQSGGGIGGLLSTLFSEGGVVEQLIGEDGDVGALVTEKEKEALETINSLFGEGGELEGVLPEDVDISSMLQTVDSKLEDINGTVQEGIQSVVEMATNEDGSIDWDKVGGSVEELIGMFTSGDLFGGGEADEQDWDALLAELLVPYYEAEAVMFAYIGERNAELLEAGDAQVFSKTATFADDIEEDVVRIIGDFTQVNYTIDGDHMNELCSATDTLLLTLTRGEDGTFTVTDEKQIEDGEGYTESLEALCEEVGISAEDVYTCEMLGVYNDAQALADYLKEHSEIATAEYKGEQMTAEELQTLVDDYSEGILDSIFDAFEEEELTEAATE